MPPRSERKYPRQTTPTVEEQLALDRAALSTKASYWNVPAFVDT
jgi:hypothetical protein